MNYLAPLGRVFGNLKGLYSGINGATLTGAIDVIIVEKEDGTYNCSPFHVRFGKLGVLRSREKVVDLEVNGHSVPIRMKLGDSGEAFFVQEFSDEEELEDENLATSPLPSSPQLSDTDLLHNSRNELPEGMPISPSNNQQAIQEDSSDQLKESSVSSSKPEENNKTRRKRRKRRRNNNGSKSDIKIEALNAEESIDGGDEDIFKMDEELESLESSSLPVPEMGKMSGSRSFHRDFYSDTEVDATNTPHPSRPSTPIQSDSELEVSKVHLIKEGDEEVGKWAWGELPSTGSSTPAITPLTAQEDKGKENEEKVGDEEKRSRTESVNKSMLSGMFSFMKGKGGKGAENSGPPAPSAMYLDDLNLEQMDPEVAALYFPNFGKAEREGRENVEEDVESGKGNSLPHSPAPGSPRNSTMAAFMEAHIKRQSEGEGPLFEGVSLCGSQLGLFDQSQMTFDELVENPSLLLNAAPESIVVKIDGRLVPWPAALSQLFSTTFFKRPLPQKVYENLIEQYTKKEGTPSLPTNGSPSKEDKEAADKKRGYTWFPWGAKSQEEEKGKLTLSPPTSSDESELNLESKSPPKTPPKSPPTPPKDLKVEEELAKIVNKPAPIDIIGMNNNRVSPDKFKKSLRLTTEQIRELGLKYGQNEAVFSVTTAYQGTSIARCHIYLWRYDDRVVISDIDGTITKSDVLGHILPIIGNDWAQSGVAHLFTQIQDNGYKMLYLSARAIGQATITREYLKSIKQGDVTLPDGPLLLNPTSLMSALHREVIEKKPEEFKIACLKDVQKLFTENPFYAGYGNKINDVWAYRAVDIPISRIFTINHKGELRHALTNTFQSSYTSLVELADHIFPVYKNTQTYQDPSQIDDFNNFEFWREPILPLEASS